MIRGIFGRTFTESSVPPASQDTDLLALWENRFRQNLAEIGSTEFDLIWTRKELSPGVWISRLAPSMRRIDDSDSTGSGWMSPLASDRKWRATPNVSAERMDTGRSISVQDQMVMAWKTPRERDGNSGLDPYGQTTRLPQDFYLTDQINFTAASWGTPTHREAGGTPEQFIDRKVRSDGRMGASLTDLSMQMRTWPTVKAAIGGPDTNRVTGESLPTYLAATSWPTPKSGSAGETSRSGDRMDEPLIGSLMRHAGIATGFHAVTFPTFAMVNAAYTASMADHPDMSGRTTMVGSWVTPSARDGKDSTGMATSSPDRVQPRNDQLPRQMVQAWSTPRSSDGAKGAPMQEFSGGGTPLPAQIYSAASWPTPVEIIGATPTGSSVTTGKRGAPNPVFAFWLMGFPVAWIYGALLVMPSFRKRRRKSSKR
jgi:hypothetical protein